MVVLATGLTMSLYTNNGMVAGQSASLIAEDPKGAFIPANSTIAIQPPVATGQPRRRKFGEIHAAQNRSCRPMR